jgi:hypothetical protein
MARKCKNPKPVNTKLYNSIKNRIKRKVKRWPSAYASGQLVQAYKRKRGKYRCNFGSLNRWFKEQWVNVCKPIGNGKYQKCGRKKSSSKGYPYCRPLKRINSKTPRTVGELSRSEIKRRCSKKHKIKGKTLKFGTVHYLKRLI